MIMTTTTSSSPVVGPGVGLAVLGRRRVRGAPVPGVREEGVLAAAGLAREPEGGHVVSSGRGLVALANKVKLLDLKVSKRPS